MPTSLQSATAIVHGRNGERCLPIATSEGGTTISVSFDGQRLAMLNPGPTSQSRRHRCDAGGVHRWDGHRSRHHPSAVRTSLFAVRIQRRDDVGHFRSGLRRRGRRHPPLVRLFHIKSQRYQITPPHGKVRIGLRRMQDRRRPIAQRLGY